MKPLRHPELRVALVLAVVVFGASFAFDALSDQHELRQHLGGEYFNIARAIVEGRGYGDPFGERTGPTAWMPPLYPTLLAAILALAKTRALTAAIVVVLENLAFVTIGTTIYALARRCSRRLPPWTAVAAYILWLLASHDWTFGLTHDVWLLMLAVDGFVVAIYLEVTGRRLPYYAWGGFGGLLLLMSPALGFAWLCTTLLKVLRSAGDRRRWVAAAACALVVLSPWVARNAAAFHRFIPVKSNVFFEAYEANYVDDDGIYDLDTMAKHPYVAHGERFHYAKLGEARYLDERKRKFVSAFGRDPARLARNVLHRTTAILGRYIPLGWEAGDPWLFVRRILAPLPGLALAASIIARIARRRLPHARSEQTQTTTRLLWAWGLMCASYLLPYALVAFYVRYLLPLVPVLVLFVFFGADDLAAALRAKREFTAREGDKEISRFGATPSSLVVSLARRH
jgi:hypothetical protein